MEISVKRVKELKLMMGYGFSMMECKKALEAAGEGLLRKCPVRQTFLYIMRPSGLLPKRLPAGSFSAGPPIRNPCWLKHGTRIPP